MAQSVLQLNSGIFSAKLEKFSLHFKEQAHIYIVQEFLTERHGYIR